MEFCTISGNGKGLDGLSVITLHLEVNEHVMLFFTLKLLMWLLTVVILTTELYVSTNYKERKYIFVI